jgi:adenylosuccinate lyase
MHIIMELTPLTAISPVDGRYRRATESLAPYFSEFGLIRYRVWVEVEYFISLSLQGLPQFPPLDENQQANMRSLYLDFDEKAAQKIKATEAVTNHDVKAVEYFLKDALPALGLADYAEFVHFGLTSQDINNTAIPLSMAEGMKRGVWPALEALADHLHQLADTWKEIPMLARTHGQPASPTRLGKELKVFEVRLREQMKVLQSVPFAAKFGGATGNFNAHTVAYPSHDWHAFGKHFVEEILGLKRSHPTTQIEHYDHMAAFFDGLKRISIILIDLARDIWQYIAMNYFKQKINPNEVGSSAMPHKVNPIDFENAEGNLGIVVALSEHLAAKLPISRLQRDLTDSTVLRNVGMPIGHFLIAIKSLEKGLHKIQLNQPAIHADLEANWAVVAEAIQTILRRESYPKPYEALKALTRTSTHIDEKAIADFIETLDVTEAVKAELRGITPFNYTGI